jgi:hypothetical protein
MHGRTRIRKIETEPVAGTFAAMWEKTRKREGRDRRQRSLQGW